MAKRICVVIPSFNRCQVLLTLAKRFSRLAGNTHFIVVVDDGSSDNSFAELNSLSLSQVYPLTISNSERGAARNFGCQWALMNLNFDYIVFFDSDDQPLDSFFALSMKLLKESNSPAWLIAGYSMSNKLSTPSSASVGRSTVTLDSLTSGNPFSPCSVFIRKDIIQQYSFCESRDLAGSEDYELWIRLARSYHAIYCPGEIICIVNNWEGRSVNNVSPEKAIRQKNAFFNSLSRNEWNIDEMSSYRMIKGSIYVYTALQLSQYRKSKLFSISCLMRGLLLNKPILLTKRPLAIIKHFLLTFK